MMPLTMAAANEINYIKKVRVISQLNGNLIVSIKDSRVAISKEMANKIMV